MAVVTAKGRKSLQAALMGLAIHGFLAVEAMASHVDPQTSTASAYRTPLVTPSVMGATTVTAWPLARYGAIHPGVENADGSTGQPC